MSLRAFRTATNIPSTMAYERHADAGCRGNPYSCTVVASCKYVSHEKTLSIEQFWGFRGVLLGLRFKSFISSLQAASLSLGVAVLLSSTSIIAERMVFRFDLMALKAPLAWPSAPCHPSGRTYRFLLLAKSEIRPHSREPFPQFGSLCVPLGCQFGSVLSFQSPDSCQCRPDRVALRRVPPISRTISLQHGPESMADPNEL
jgi:hypothetical protein